MCELGPLLFELTLGDIPVAFGFEFIHCFVFVDIAVRTTLGGVRGQATLRS